MNEDIKFALEYLKNKTSDDVLSQRHIKDIEEYIESLIYCINNNNLQSKIDKANEILSKLEMQPAYLDCKYYELDGFNELKNALKEDK